MTNTPFESPHYSLSDRYDLLWDVIQEGARIPAWIVYPRSENLIHDLVEIKKAGWHNYTIGTRGLGYGDGDTKEEFISDCKHYSLKFIIPDSKR